MPILRKKYLQKYQVRSLLNTLGVRDLSESKKQRKREERVWSGKQPLTQTPVIDLFFCPSSWSFIQIRATPLRLLALPTVLMADREGVMDPSTAI